MFKDIKEYLTFCGLKEAHIMHIMFWLKLISTLIGLAVIVLFLFGLLKLLDSIAESIAAIGNER